ncbi:glycoside hydrolase family 16 protein [Mucilaginibacter robiniae]|uniref:Glycoside hydrolase family 16 protein n=1 Tax=Mucilaginibacter robiniae TaxID=2728022 RepID=A0A7L5E3X4_9SPHI|nr:glycoside hydrolase family 16 protein [Mucilaginibacter robiniae]QJD95513.1 glycoside hydrolase family 16 protein [Mucilaginibacter robiniae]
MKLKYTCILYFLAAVSIVSCSGKKETAQPYVNTVTAPVDKGWTFETTPTWKDEFDYTGLPDTTKWGYDIGGSGWGNNELEYYTNSINNARVANDKLTITLRKENVGGRNYTSARLASRNKFDFLYGRVEVKAKLPSGKGTWPAIWMLPTDYAYGAWPASGEFDIMEMVGYDPNVIHVSAHTGKYNFKQNNQKTNITRLDDAINTYHLYRVDWTPYSVKGYVDNVPVLEYVNDGTGSYEWPFDKRFHMLLNIAYGGDWGGAQGIDDNTLPATMDVDYIRYYKMIDK